MLLPEARKTYILEDREEELEAWVLLLSACEYEGHAYVLLSLYDDEPEEDEAPSDVTEASVFLLSQEDSPLVIKDLAGKQLAFLLDAEGSAAEAVTDRLLDLI